MEIVLADVSGGPLGNELVHRVAVVGDLPGDLEVLVELPCHGQKKRGLARARRSEQQRHPPGLDDPADVVEDGHGLLPAGDDVERVPDGLEHTEQSTDLDIEKGHGSSNGVACGGACAGETRWTRTPCARRNAAEPRGRCANIACHGVEVGRFRGVYGGAVEVPRGRERPWRRRAGAGAGGHRRRVFFFILFEGVAIGGVLF